MSSACFCGSDTARFGYAPGDYALASRLIRLRTGSNCSFHHQLVSLSRTCSGMPLPHQLGRSRHVASRYEVNPETRKLQMVLTTQISSVLALNASSLLHKLAGEHQCARPGSIRKTFALVFFFLPPHINVQPPHSHPHPSCCTTTSLVCSPLYQPARMSFVRHRALSFPHRYILRSFKTLNFTPCVSSSMPSRKGMSHPSS